MKQKGTQREEALAALHNSYERACSTVEALASEAIRCGLWEQADFGRRLSDLYLRLKQGPVRAVVMGQTSSGKSTLINALVGGIIAPESADVCSPIPVCFMKDKQTDTTSITYFARQEQGLPKERYANNTFLLQWHHDSGTLAQDNGSKPFVHTVGKTFPQSVTLIDSPGLNANAADTDRLYALFDRPSYAVPDEPDLPELVLYISTAGGNLSEEEMNNLKQLLDRGVDLHRIFIVHNEFCSDIENLKPDQFERADDAARNGLAESLRALQTPLVPDVISMDTDDSSAIFGAFLVNNMSASDGYEAYAHIVSLNALFARVFYAGAYDPLGSLITGATEEQYRQLMTAKKNPKQDRVIELCAAWREAKHTDYQPLLHLRDVIDEQALNLAETADLKAALRAVGRLGDELLERRRQQLRDEAARERKPILEWTKGLNELRRLLKSAQDGLPQRVAKCHEKYASWLKDTIQEMLQERDGRIRGYAEKIRTEWADIRTMAERFCEGMEDSRSFLLLGALLSGIGGAASYNPLKVQFEARLARDPFFKSKDILAQKQLLLQAYQNSETRQEVFAALERVCQKMIDSINISIRMWDDKNVKAVRKLPDEYFQSLAAILKEDAAGIQSSLSSYCKSMQEKASGKERQLVDDLMKKPAFSAAASDQIEDGLNWRIPEQICDCFGSIISAVCEAVMNPIQKTDHIAQQIRERYGELSTQADVDVRSGQEVNVGNVRDLVFQQVICPTLASAAEKAIGAFDIEKINGQMDKLLKAAQEYADQTMENVFLNGSGLVEACDDAFSSVMKQWIDPEKEADSWYRSFQKGDFDNG